MGDCLPYSTRRKRRSKKKTCAQNTLLVRNAEILVGSEGHSILLSFYGETNRKVPKHFCRCTLDWYLNWYLDWCLVV